MTEDYTPSKRDLVLTLGELAVAINGIGAASKALHLVTGGYGIAMPSDTQDGLSKTLLRCIETKETIEQELMQEVTV